MKFSKIPERSPLSFGRCASVGHYQDNEIYTVCGYKYQDKFLVDIGFSVSFPFDTRERNSTNAIRKRHGNNFYKESNLRQFLNADDSNYFIPQNEGDENAWTSQRGETKRNPAGFLQHFTDEELACLEPIEYICAVPPGHRRGIGYTVKLTDRVVPLSAAQLVDPSNNAYNNAALDEFVKQEGQFDSNLLDLCLRDKKYFYTITRSYYNDRFIAEVRARQNGDSYSYVNKESPCNSACNLFVFMKIKPDTEFVLNPDSNFYVFDTEKNLLPVSETNILKELLAL